MTHSTNPIEVHYAVGGIQDAILRGLESQGLDLDALTPADLAPVDEFHIRGRQATVDLANRARIEPGLRVLDVGAGLGGSVRYLAAERGCRAVGLDVTSEYVDVARFLADRVGLADVEFHLGSALELPFEEATFDVVWTEHAQMNIADKDRFYSELARVLRPGGRLAFHDVFAGTAGAPHFPVPWAQEPSISHLWSPAEARASLTRAGFELEEWEDVTAPSADFFRQVLARVQEAGPPPLGIHLLMGSTAADKLRNITLNLEEDRIHVAQAIARRS